MSKKRHLGKIGKRYRNNLWSPKTKLKSPIMHKHVGQANYIVSFSGSIGQNGSGKNGTDKMVWTKWYADKMVLDKMVWTKWYGQNGTDKLLWIKLSIINSRSQ